MGKNVRSFFMGRANNPTLSGRNQRREKAPFKSIDHKTTSDAECPDSTAEAT
jgi:hypothetical protein